MLMNLINNNSDLLALIGAGVVLLFGIYLLILAYRNTLKVIMLGGLLCLGFISMKYMDNKAEIDDNINTVIEKGTDIKDEIKDQATRTTIVSTKILKVLK